MMTPEEAGVLSDFGISILHAVTWLTTISLLQGMFILLFAVTAHTLLRRSPQSAATWVMLCVTIVCFLLATLHWSAEISVITIGVRSALVNNLHLPLNVRQQMTDSNARTANRIVVWTQFLPLISDAVVVWRAWAILGRQRWISVGPILLLLSATSMTFAYLGYSSKLSSPGLSNSEFVLINNIHTSKLALSLATNAVATFLIAYKLWSHRRAVDDDYLDPESQTSSGRLTLALIESGALYCAIQALNLGLNLSKTSDQDSAINFTSQVVFAAYIEISAIYPTIVILLIATKRSFVYTYGLSEVSGLKDDGTDSVHEVESHRGRAGRFSLASARTSLRSSVHGDVKKKVELTRTMTRAPGRY